MTKIFTSYYGSKQLNPQKHFLVRISNGCPRAIHTDAVLNSAIPDWNSIVVPYKDGRINEEDYKHRYLRILNGRKDMIRQELVPLCRKAGQKDVVLLCFEATGKFCHRHIFADWAKENLQMDITELGQIEQSTGRLF